MPCACASRVATRNSVPPVARAIAIKHPRRSGNIDHCGATRLSRRPLAESARSLSSIPPSKPGDVGRDRSRVRSSSSNERTGRQFGYSLPSRPSQYAVARCHSSLSLRRCSPQNASSYSDDVVLEPSVAIGSPRFSPPSPDVRASHPLRTSARARNMTESPELRVAFMVSSSARRIRASGCGGGSACSRGSDPEPPAPPSPVESAEPV